MCACVLRHFSSVQFSRSVMPDSLRPHELQRARSPCLSPTPDFTQTHVHWVSDAIHIPIGMSEVAQSCPTLCDPMDCSLPGSSIRGILQARILEWVAISFSRGSSQPRDWTQVSRIRGRCFNLWATRKAQIYPYPYPYSYLYLYPYLSILPGSKINHKYYISCCNSHCIWSVYLPRIHCFEVSISPCNKVRPSTQSCQPDLASLSF